MTAEDLLAMPKDDLLHELVRGELRTMAPAGFEHGDIGSELLGRMRSHAKAAKLGKVVGPDTGFTLSRDPDTVRSPDIAFVRASRVPVATPEGFFPGAPDLAVEVLSPGDRMEEVEEKVDEYFAAGTHVVWAVSPRRKTVRVYRRDGTSMTLRVSDTLDGGEVLAGFTCKVAELFSEVAK